MEFSTTMIIGAMARMGIVWLAMAHGMTDMSIAPIVDDPHSQKDPRKPADDETHQRRRQRLPGVEEQAPRIGPVFAAPLAQDRLAHRGVPKSSAAT